MEASVERLPLATEELALWRSPDINPQARLLKRAILAARHSATIERGEALGELYLPRLLAEPRATLDAIEDLLPRLPVATFAVDRAALFDIAAQLNAGDDRVRKLAQRELTETVVVSRQLSPNSDEAERNRVLSSDKTTFVPLLAHQALLKQAARAEQALEGTEQAILAQTDGGVRNNLAAQHLKTYPEHRTALLALFAREEIKVTFDETSAAAIAPRPAPPPRADGGEE